MKERFRFGTGVRFEMLYSLAALLEKDRGGPDAWRDEARARLDGPLGKALRWFGGSSFFWILVADVPGETWVGDDADALLRGIREADPEALRRSILTGALHVERVVERVLSGRVDLARGLQELPPQKREWLEHIELYPPLPDRPTYRAVSRCLEEPVEARDRIVEVLGTYRREIFDRTWNDLRPALERSLEEKRRLFDATSLEEFFRLALIRVEVDADAQVLRALRGGYELPFAQLREAWVVPSFFNRHRYWTAYGDAEAGSVAFLPYFDHEIRRAPGAPARLPGPPLDVALVFKALGDPTRMALASLIARTAMSSARLADELGVTRPTISHHVMLLREAGLIDEESRGGSVYLSLNRGALADLSRAALERFFGE